VLGLIESPMDADPATTILPAPSIRTESSVSQVANDAEVGIVGKEVDRVTSHDHPALIVNRNGARNDRRIALRARRGTPPDPRFPSRP
jgi:hypothetical protein